MTGDFQREYLVRLPLPLAQLYSRAYNAPAAQARHDNAFYLFEALIKLAACPHVMAYLHEVDHGAQRVDSLDRLLAHLALPSLGQWAAILRELAKHFGSRPDAASHPLGHVWEQLKVKHRDLPGILELFRRIKNGPDGKPAGDQSCSLLQLVDALVLYRNAVFGHGATRFDAFYEQEMGPLLFPAVSELLAAGVFNMLGPPGSRLVYVAELRSIDELRVQVELQELVGLKSERMAAGELLSEEADHLAPNCVAILWPGRKVPLRIDPLLVFRGSELTDELLFLNRDRNGRQVEYLSYTTGKTERDKSMAPAMSKLLSRITGHEVTEENLAELEKQSLAETPSVDLLFEERGSPRQTLGDYEILAQIGRGGMGVVYLARQMSLGRLVALKTLPADLAGDEVTLARFRREMKALGRCEHPNIVKVLNSGTLPDGQVFYAMELIPGADLEMVWRELSSDAYQGEASKLGGTTWGKAVLTATKKQREQVARRASGMPTVAHDKTEADDKTEQGNAPTEGESVGQAAESLPYPPLPDLPDVESDPGGYARHVSLLIRDAARALQEVHDEKIIHRDIKPANLMLSPDGSRVVLMDFGLAKGEHLTTTAGRSGGFLGTLRYAAPEQLAAAKIKIGPQADVRALGATLWELLTRKRLFGEAEDENQLASYVLTREVPRVRSVDSSIDRDLEAIVAKATERDAALRYQSAEEFADDLERWERGEQVKARRYTLLNRASRQLHRHRKIASAAALLIVAALAFGLWYWDGYQRLHVEYYARAVSRYGEPQGVRRLSLDEVHHRSASLKMFRRGRYGYIFEMQEINGSGQPGKSGLWVAMLPSMISTEGSRDDYRFTFERDANGNVVCEVAYDVAGRVSYAFKHNSTFNGGYYVDDHGYPLLRSGSGAAFEEYKRSPKGLYTEILFRDAYGQPQRDKDGDYGIRYEHDPDDERGLITKFTVLDFDETPRRHKDGYVSIRYEYDSDGNTIAYHMLDERDRPTLHDNGYATIRNRYDQYGNRLEQTYFGIDGRPTLHKNGFTRLTNKYDNRGNSIETAYWGPNGDLVLSNNGYARLVAKYDARGNEIENARYGVDREPTFSNFGVWKFRRKYDDQNNLIEESYIGVDGNPVLHADGMAFVKNKFDDRGNKTEQAFCGLGGEAVLSVNGYAKWTARYDKNGKQTEVAYFGTDGRLTLRKDGYARLTTKRDPRGNAIEQSYWDVNGNLTLNKDGYAREVLKYDTFGNPSEARYFGVNNRPVALSNGVSKLVAEYDHRGNIVKIAYYDTNEQPTLSNDGAAYHKNKYDERDNKTEMAYYGVNNELVENTDLFAVKQMKYDEHGNQIELRYFDAKDSPTLVKDGFFRAVKKYDSRGNLVEVAYFDTAGNPVAHKEQNARWTAKFDDRGNRIRVETFGVDGKPARDHDGYIKWVADYDTRGSLLERTYSGYDGSNNFFQLKNTYDEKGNLVTKSFFDEDGNAVLHKEGYSGWKSTYDTRGNEIKRLYVGIDGRPKVINAGVAGWKASYDERGKQTEKIYFDTEERITAHSDGNSKLVKKYDPKGNEIATSYLDAYDHLVVVKRLGYAKVEREFDERGNKTKVTFFGADGNPIATSEYNAGWTAEFDARGNQTAKSYFDVTGKLARNKPGGYWSWTAEYDERDRLVQTSTFGFDKSAGYFGKRVKYNRQGKDIETVLFEMSGSPAENESGHARWTKDYDAAGNQIAEAYFDAEDKPAPYNSGYVRWEAEYDGSDLLTKRYFYRDPDKGYAVKRVLFDKDGNETEIAFFDKSGGLVESKNDGYARSVSKYDKRGVTTERAYFDQSNAPQRTKDGYTRWTAKLDDQSRPVEITYYGYDAKQLGYAQARIKFDSYGNVAEMTVFDEAGKRARGSNGVSRTVRRFDDKKNVIEAAFYGPDDRPVRIGDGYSGWTASYYDNQHVRKKTFTGFDASHGFSQIGHSYDEQGNELEELYLDDQGELTNQGDGYARIAMKYDSRGNLIDMTLYDKDGELAQVASGISRIEFRYDAKGNKISEAYFGADQQPVLNVKGYARWSSSYDSAGRHVDRQYFGLKGELLQFEVVVTEVFPGTQGAKLGIQKGDILVRYNGSEVSDAQSFTADLVRRAEDPKNPRILEIRRGGELLKFEIDPGLLGVALADRINSTEQQMSDP